jgi:GMP synthase-like glutamine amidotransferase
VRPVVIVQHDPHDGPSFFAEWLNRQGIAHQVFAMHDGQALPQHMQAFSGLCVLGGPMSANDDLPYYPQLMALMRQAFAQAIPVIGHCLGGQLMSRVLGGTVQAAENAEIGWSTLQATHPLAADWFGTDPLQLFQWHSESFSIPPGATQLLRGSLCANQAFVWQQRHLAMQFHCEVDVAKVRTWLDIDAHEIERCASPGVHSVESLKQGLEAAVQHSQRIASHIYTRWAQGLTL